MWINPLLLGFAALGTVPIIIHLLNKRRFKPMQWAAMEFLLQAIKQNTRRIQLRDIILMIIRTLAVVLMALLLARPVIAVKAGIFGRRTAAVVMMDNSLSMGFHNGRETRFDKSKRMVKEIFTGLSGDDIGALYLFNEGPRKPLGDPPQNRGYLIQELEKSISRPAGTPLYRSDAGTELESAFQEALKLYEKNKEFKATNNELYILTDMQADPWMNPNNEAGFKEMLKKLGEAFSIYLVNAGDTGGENAVLESLKASDELAAVDLEVEFVAEIKNFSDEEMLGVAVDLYVDPTGEEDEAPTQRNTVDLPPLGKASVSFRHAFESGGDHKVEVRLAGDRLAADNIRHIIIRVVEEARVLLVNGREQRFDDPLSTATPYLRRALAPRNPDNPDDKQVIRADVINTMDLSGANLQDYDTTVLADVGGLNKSDAAALAKRVKDGMGLMIFLGENTIPEEYEALFGKEGEGLLPCGLGKPWGEKPKIDVEEEPKVFRIMKNKLDHPVISEFKHPMFQPLLEAISIYKGHELKIQEEQKDSHVIAWFSNNQPAFMEKRFGSGRVFISSIPATTDWSNFPMHQGFIIIMLRSANYVSSGALASANLTVNEKLKGYLPPADLSRSLAMKAPQPIGRQEITGKLLPDGRAEFTFEQTDLGGIYSAELNSDPVRHYYYAVNPDVSKESDLTTVSPEEIRKKYPDFKFVYIAQTADLGKKLADERSGIELWPWLIALVFLLLLLESILANRWAPRE